jgi:D-lactate dehydrogenase
MRGFGCRLLGFDPFPSSLCKSFGVEYISSPELFADANIITPSLRADA